ncbi:hypothetical protein V6C27_12250 [Peptococcaceae bacterium 1198_IL3148]
MSSAKLSGASRLSAKFAPAKESERTVQNHQLFYTNSWSELACIISYLL